MLPPTCYARAASTCLGAAAPSSRPPSTSPRRRLPRRPARPPDRGRRRDGRTAVAAASTAGGGPRVDALRHPSFATVPHVDVRICLLQAGASLFASIFGFGDAVIAVPLLAVLFHFEATQAAPLVVFVTFFLTMANAIADVEGGIQQEAGRWSTSAAMIGGAAAGVPIGVSALVQVEPWAIRAGVGSFLLLYGVYDIFGSERGDACF